VRWMAVILGLVAILVGFALGVLAVIYRGPSTYVKFTEANQDLGEICANATVSQKNEMIVNGKAYIQIAATIYDVQTGTAYYPLTQSYVLAVDTGDKEQTVKDLFTWQAPALPPAKYKRVLAASTYRNVEPTTTISIFNLIDCDAGGKPIKP
jgi:hypothetical protein